MPAPLLIADSGPLIALARLDLLGLPARFFTEVLVPDTVWLEVSRNAPELEGLRLRSAIATRSFRVVADPPIDSDALPEALRGGGIDLGELAVIVLARDMGAAALLDDLRGRRAALALKLPMLGTLALLGRARETGAVAALRPLVDHLSSTGYFLPADAVRRLLAELGE